MVSWRAATALATASRRAWIVAPIAVAAAATVGGSLCPNLSGLRAAAVGNTEVPLVAAIDDPTLSLPKIRAAAK